MRQNQDFLPLLNRNLEVAKTNEYDIKNDWVPALENTINELKKSKQSQRAIIHHTSRTRVTTSRQHTHTYAGTQTAGSTQHARGHRKKRGETIKNIKQQHQ